MKKKSREYQLSKQFVAKVKDNGLQRLSRSQRAPRKTVADAVAERKQLENTAFAQDIALKRNTLITLFVFLGFESLLVFWYAFLQAVEAWGFALEEWSFRLLLTATLIQITLMVQIAVKHLFPTPQEKEEKKVA